MRFASAFFVLLILTPAAAGIQAAIAEPMQAVSVVIKKNGQDWSILAPALLQKKDFQGLLQLSQKWIESDPTRKCQRLV
jgi:hypothetical protein